MKTFKRAVRLVVLAVLIAGMTLSVACKSKKKEPPAAGGTYYTVTFINNDGTDKYTQVSVKENETVNRPTDPTRDGYTFVNWFKTADGSGEAYSFTSPVTSSFNLYAKWADNNNNPPPSPPPVTEKVTITYMTDGGSLASTTQQIDKGSQLTPPVPTRLGWDFIGWYTNSNCDEASKFADGTIVNNSITLYAKWQKQTSGGNTQPAESFTVSFDSNGGDTITPQSVEKGSLAVRPATPVKTGYLFGGWYTDNTTFSHLYNFDVPVTSSFTLYAKWTELESGLISVGAYNESIYAEWSESNISAASVSYKAKNESGWKSVDKPLIRAASESGVARVDIPGLKAGEYEIKITPATGAEITTPSVTATEYDRSGYAHFNYSEGIGAYKDDGTLKDGALIIYVTDENKNNILDYAYCNGVKVNIENYMKATQEALTGGVTVGQQTGIGELLNNRRYSGNDRWNVGISKLCEVYGAVAIRIIGKVSAEIPNSMESSINGLTTYDSQENGGSTGDNGRMARMVNAHDLTIEGVGYDSAIYGWGVHFISSYYSGKTERMGKGFEVRNITFEHNPEDAVGMEGEQGVLTSGGSVTDSSRADSDLLSPVERCWVHNNTFLPGYAYKCTDSDKSEGDGSCDFKRGLYFTLSYNYFENCHKTNLIGSGDSSLQYNITMHHNWWNNCQSRMPLLRRANVHFYNNYISADMTRDPKPELGHVTSARANSYMFAEGNYYDGCKNIVLTVTGAVVKSYNNIVYANFDDDNSTYVKTRDQQVSSNCEFKYRNIDYRNFDTNEELFYYDATNKVSDCLLDDAVSARVKVMQHAGVNEFGTDNTAMNKYEPTSAVSVPTDGVSIDLKGSGENNGVLLVGVSSGKYKGQGITFKLTAPALVTITTSTTGSTAPELVGASGKVYAHKFEGTLKIELQAGTYFIASGQKDKEVTITGLKFEDSASSSAARKQALIEAINAIPSDITLTEEVNKLITAAEVAYSAMTAAEAAEFETEHGDLLQKLNNARADYDGLCVQDAIDKIDAIGTVTKDSYPAIEAAQEAYNSLAANLRSQVTNYDKLAAALEAWANFAVQGVIDAIANLPVASSVDIGDRTQVETLKARYDAVYDMYDNLSDGSDGSENQKASVTNVQKLTDGIALLEQYAKLFDFTDMLNDFAGKDVTFSDAAKVNALQKLYGELTIEQKAKLNGEQTALYQSVLAAYAKLQEEVITVSFEGGVPSNPMFEQVGSKKNGGGKDFTVHAANKTFKSGAKMESTTDIKLTLSGKKIVKLYMSPCSSTYLLIDDVKHSYTEENGDYVITLTLESGEHHIKRGDKESHLFYAVISPAPAD